MEPKKLNKIIDCLSYVVDLNDEQKNYFQNIHHWKMQKSLVICQLIYIIYLEKILLIMIML